MIYVITCQLGQHTIAGFQRAKMPIAESFFFFFLNFKIVAQDIISCPYHASEPFGDINCNVWYSCQGIVGILCWSPSSFFLCAVNFSHKRCRVIVIDNRNVSQKRNKKEVKFDRVLGFLLSVYNFGSSPMFCNRPNMYNIFSTQNFNII